MELGTFTISWQALANRVWDMNGTGKKPAVYAIYNRGLQHFSYDDGGVRLTIGPGETALLEGSRISMRLLDNAAIDVVSA